MEWTQQKQKTRKQAVPSAAPAVPSSAPAEAKAKPPEPSYPPPAKAASSAGEACPLMQAVLAQREVSMGQTNRWGLSKTLGFLKLITLGSVRCVCLEFWIVHLCPCMFVFRTWVSSVFAIVYFRMCATSKYLRAWILLNCTYGIDTWTWLWGFKLFWKYDLGMHGWSWE